MPSERETLAHQVVDFSLAQCKGLIAAFMEVFGKTDMSIALKNLKGFHENFCAQVTCIKLNHTVVATGEEVSFNCIHGFSFTLSLG